MRFRLPPLLLTLLLTGCSPSSADADTRPLFDESPWHDGNAEVNFYDATELRYGEQRTADEAVLIFVKEDHRSDMMVKADDPGDADLPAVKLNWVVEIPTGLYTYRQQASVFVNRETNLPFRQTFASHEWCGNVFKDLRRTGPDAYRYEWTTYFEQDGEGSRQIATDTAAPVIFADALPVYVRTVQRDHAVAVLPSLRSIRAQAEGFGPAPGTLELGEEREITVPAGDFVVQPVTVTYEDGRVDVYEVEAGGSRRLLRMRLADGSCYELRRSLRIDYWNRNAPTDEALREE